MPAVAVKAMACQGRMKAQGAQRQKIKTGSLAETQGTQRADDGGQPHSAERMVHSEKRLEQGGKRGS